MEKSFLIYIAAICCFGFGFADFNPVYLVAVFVASQMLSIIFYSLCIKVRKA